MSDITREFNAAAWFADRQVREGQGGRLAIVRGGRTLTYGDLAAGVNRVGNALTRLGVRMEQRVMLLLPDYPESVAFLLYTSGTTGTPKAAVHLHHDMLVCCEGFGRHVLEIGPEDRTFSVAKLFFAYGLGNALYF